MLPKPMDEPIAAIKNAVYEPHDGRFMRLGLKLVNDTVFICCFISNSGMIHVN